MSPLRHRSLSGRKVRKRLGKAKSEIRPRSRPKSDWGLVRVLRADRAGPDHVKVPRRKQRVVPAPDVAQDRGLKFRHDVQGNDLPPCRLEGSANRLCAAKQLQQSRHV